MEEQDHREGIDLAGKHGLGASTTDLTRLHTATSTPSAVEGDVMRPTSDSSI